MTKQIVVLLLTLVLAGLSVTGTEQNGRVKVILTNGSQVTGKIVYTSSRGDIQVELDNYKGTVYITKPEIKTIEQCKPELTTIPSSQPITQLDSNFSENKQNLLSGMSGIFSYTKFTLGSYNDAIALWANYFRWYGSNYLHLNIWPINLTPIVSLNSSGAQLSYKISRSTYLAFKSVKAAWAGRQTLNTFRSTYYDDITLTNTFDIYEIGAGIGFLNSEPIISGAQESFLIMAGFTSVELKHVFTESYYLPSPYGSGVSRTEFKYSGIKPYLELGIIESVFITSNRRISIDLSFGYKTLTFDDLDGLSNLFGQKIRFDFSGFNAGVGLTARF
jgi:hypothetical protein